MQQYGDYTFERDPDPTIVLPAVPLETQRAFRRCVFWRLVGVVAWVLFAAIAGLLAAGWLFGVT